MIKKTTIQFLKFAIVGVINTLVNLIVLYLLTEFFGIYYMVSAVFAFLVAVTNSFILNKIWTFNENISENIFNRYIKFFAVSTFALLINLMILYLFTEFLRIYYMASQIIAIALSLWINFFFNKLWTFKRYNSEKNE